MASKEALDKFDEELERARRHTFENVTKHHKTYIVTRIYKVRGADEQDALLHLNEAGDYYIFLADQSIREYKLNWLDRLLMWLVR